MIGTFHDAHARLTLPGCYKCMMLLTFCEQAYAYSCLFIECVVHANNIEATYVLSIL